MLAGSAARPAMARPEYLVRFQADPMRKAGIDGCGACHVKPEGGGARNDFGAAYDAGGARNHAAAARRVSVALHLHVGDAARRLDVPFSDPQSRVGDLRAREAEDAW